MYARPEANRGNNSCETDVKQLRYNFLRRSFQLIPNYWMRTLPPRITQPVMRREVVPRIRQSLELLAAAHATPQEELDRWWFRAQLPTSMGGEGVGGHDEQCDAAYSAGVIACWPRLRETSSCFAEVPLLANIPMLRDFTQSFLRLVQLRDDIDATYTEFAKHPHHFITGDKFKGYFCPQKLPTTLRTIRELFQCLTERTLLPPNRAADVLPGQTPRAVAARAHGGTGCRRATRRQQASYGSHLHLRIPVWSRGVAGHSP